MYGEYLRLHKYVEHVESLSDAERAAYFDEAEFEAHRPAKTRTLCYSADMNRNPVTEDVSSESTDTVKDRVAELLDFIRASIGPRCVDAAKAIMEGATGCKEIGDKMGVCRHTAIGHVRNLQSEAVQKKAIELGLITRGAFIKTVMKMSEPSKKRAKKSTAKSRRRVRRSASKSMA